MARTFNLEGLLREFLDYVLARTGKAKEQVSAAAAAQTLTITAPGAGKRVSLQWLRAVYSDGTSHNTTIGWTQDGAAASMVVSTGAERVLSGLFISGDENTAITIDAPAGALGVTNRLQVNWTEENV